jgi:hypothetical protein
MPMLAASAGPVFSSPASSKAERMSNLKVDTRKRKTTSLHSDDDVLIFEGEELLQGRIPIWTAPGLSLPMSSRAERMSDFNMDSIEKHTTNQDIDDALVFGGEELLQGRMPLWTAPAGLVSSPASSKPEQLNSLEVDVLDRRATNQDIDDALVFEGEELLQGRIPMLTAPAEPAFSRAERTSTPEADIHERQTKINPHKSNSSKHSTRQV